MRHAVFFHRFFFLFVLLLALVFLVLCTGARMRRPGKGWMEGWLVSQADIGNWSVAELCFMVW